MGNIARVNIDISRLEYILDSENVSKEHLLEYGDILFNTRNTLDLVGKVSIWRNELPCAYYNSNILRLEFKQDYCGDSQYYGYALNSKDAIDTIRILATGTTSVAAVYTRDLLKLRVAVPSKAEQRGIVAALYDADSLISTLERSIEKKQAIKQGMMQQLLTGKTRLPGFTGPWSVTTLGELALFSKGVGLPKSDLVTDGQLPCIHYGELFTYYGPEIDVITSRTNNAGLRARSVEMDVLMPTSDVTPRGLAKASAVLGEGVILGGDILIIRPDRQRLYGPFLAHAIRGDPNQVLQLVRGSTVFHIYAADMKNFAFRVPSLEEQSAVCLVLRDAQLEIERLDRRLAKAKAIKQGMMQQLLTCRTRLPVTEPST
jgi:type I restriction enzyme S subunit